MRTLPMPTYGGASRSGKEERAKREPEVPTYDNRDPSKRPFRLPRLKRSSQDPEEFQSEKSFQIFLLFSSMGLLELLLIVLLNRTIPTISHFRQWDCPKYACNLEHSYYSNYSDRSGRCHSYGNLKIINWGYSSVAFTGTVPICSTLIGKSWLYVRAAKRAQAVGEGEQQQSAVMPWIANEKEERGEPMKKDGLKGETRNEIESAEREAAFWRAQQNAFLNQRYEEDLSKAGNIERYPFIRPPNGERKGRRTVRRRGTRRGAWVDFLKGSQFILLDSWFGPRAPVPPTLTAGRSYFISRGSGIGKMLFRIWHTRRISGPGIMKLGRHYTVAMLRSIMEEEWNKWSVGNEAAR
ncbi:uncharacterized protein LOC143359825 [Halictus rubicundus]|uniref:uncharacterized protein LOC143359825 n=1 Tax=Halictus rubicundus TaxID=77578 RepID=UPI004035AA15